MLFRSRRIRRNLDGDGKLTVTIQVPPNTTATVRLPKAKLEQVTEGQKPLTSRADIFSARQAGDTVVVDVGSGQYVFESMAMGAN